MIKTYAKVVNNTVKNVITSTQEDIVTFDGTFIECSLDGSIRYNYPEIGAEYRESDDAFINPPLHSDWILNTETFKWEPPVAKPAENYLWSDGAWREFILDSRTGPEA